MQPAFSKTDALQALALGLLVIAARAMLAQLPDRVELGPRTAALRADPVRFDAAGFAPFRLVGAWRLTSSDPRFGGISALAIDHGRLLALSDSGVLMRFAPPGMGPPTVDVVELPDGPGSPDFKFYRDSEALTADPAGRGYWVAFEERHQLWLYDRALRRPLLRIMLGARRWPLNLGIEGLTRAGPALLLFPEEAHTVLRVHGTWSRQSPFNHPWGSVSEAARLPDGRLILIERKLTMLGFRDRLALVTEDGGALRVTRQFALAVGPFDNLEAMAAQPLPGGGTRLWLMTDDNFQPPMRTLLLALDLPATGGRKR